MYKDKQKSENNEAVTPKISSPFNRYRLYMECHGVTQEQIDIIKKSFGKRIVKIDIFSEETK